MYPYIHAYINIYMYMYINRYTYIYIYISVYTHRNTFIYTNKYYIHKYRIQLANIVFAKLYKNRKKRIISFNNMIKLKKIICNCSKLHLLSYALITFLKKI